MKVLTYIMKKLKKGRLHMTLLDPEKGTSHDIGKLAEMASNLGTDAIMVGGSTGVDQKILDANVREIKARTSVPVILFPADSSSLSPYADAIYFMSLLNSRSVTHVVREQRRASQAIKGMGLETIPMGYVIVDPGMKAGEVGEADLLRRDSSEGAVSYALTAEYFGMKLFYLEAGSGAPSPVPSDMIRAVKEESRLPLLVGGGIRSPEAAREVAEAGADIVVTGTVVERENGSKALKAVIHGVKGW
ncbi:MAG: geranylgeranylglyceryl/heptaprenylglyceryl phosphate synthase [Thermoplasmata archaeon]